MISVPWRCKPSNITSLGSATLHNVQEGAKEEPPQEFHFSGSTHKLYKEDNTDDEIELCLWKKLVHLHFVAIKGSESGQVVLYPFVGIELAEYTRNRCRIDVELPWISDERKVKQWLEVNLFSILFSTFDSNCA